MNVTKKSKVKSNSKQDEVGTSSSNTTKSWKSTCGRSLRSLVGLKSTHVSLTAQTATRSKSTHVSPIAQTVTRSKSVEQSSSNAAKKTEVLKKPPLNKLKKEVKKPQDSTVVAQKKEIHKNEGPKDSKVASKKREISQITQKTVVSKDPEKDMEKLFSELPDFHIRLDDGDDEEYKQSGEKCILCNKDLSCSPNNVGQQSGPNDDYKYRVKFIPQMLPAVDFLPCGHAIHTDCSIYALSAESNVPTCFFCLSMS